jgi:hypothetical protein
MGNLEDRYIRLCALAAEKVTYKPTQPCINGHDCERYAITNRCIECGYIASKRYKAENVEKIAEYQREYNKQYRIDKSEMLKEARKRWDESCKKKRAKQKSNQKPKGTINEAEDDLGTD